MKGAYKKRGDVPITARPCEHLVLFDKSPVRGGGVRIVSFHGDDDGEAGITGREV